MTNSGPSRRLPVTVFGRLVPYEIMVVLSAIVYFLFARLGLTFATLQESASPIWPASGIAVALLILYERRMWLAVALGALAANLMTGGTVTAGFIAAGNTLEAIFGLLIFSRIAAIDTNQLPIARSSALILAAFVAPLASAGLGVGTLAISGALGDARFVDVFLTWWAGDMLGILLLVPAMVAFSTKPAVDAAAGMPALVRRFVLIRHVGLILALTFAAAGIPFLQSDWSSAFLFVLPILLVAAYWLGARGISLVLLVTAGIWLWGTSLQRGPFLDTSLNDSLLNMQIMLSAVAATGLILADVHYVRSRAATAVFLIGCLISAAIFVTQDRGNRDVDQRHLANVAERTQAHIAERMTIYVNALRSGASFYAASEQITRAEWKTYVGSLDLLHNFPGVYGLGLVLPTPKEDAESLVAALRKDNAPDFAIRPVPNVAPSDAEFPEHFVIAYAEPADRNAAAVGLDLASEPRRRLGAITARETGAPTITSRITLVQDQQKGPGFLLFVPMYHQGPVVNGDGLAAASFAGWIYTPFTSGTFFGDALRNESKELDLRIYDGSRTAPETLLFDSLPNDDAAPPFLPVLQTRLMLFGHEFTLLWQPSATFLSAGHRLATLFSGGLVLFSTLLAALVATLLSQRERAAEIAQQMTAALTASNERFSLAVACTNDGIWDYDLVANKVWVSPRYYEMFGYDSRDHSDPRAFWNDIIMPDDAAAARRQFEQMVAGDRDNMDILQRYRHKDGHIIHVHSRAMPIRNSDGAITRVLGVQTDISLVVRLQQQMQDAISVMPDGFGLFDTNDRIILFNEGFIDEGTRKLIGDPAGCTFEEIVRAFVEYDMPEAKDPAFDREAWIARRMERHRNPPREPIEVKWGGDRWMRISERRTADGGYVGIWSDVTEIKRLGQRLRYAIDAMTDGFALFDASDKLVACNDGFLSESLRAAFPDPTGHSFEELYRVFAKTDPVMGDIADRETWLRERLALHRNPPSQPYDFTGSNGQVTRIMEQRTADGGWVGTWTNVTAERRAQQRLQDAISAMADGFALFDAEDRLVICNSAFMHSPSLRDIGNLAGSTMEEILRVFAYSNITDIRAKKDPEAWIAYRLARHRNPTSEPYEQVITDGRVIHITERPTSDGGIVGIWSDVTALRMAERRLQDAIASISEGFMLLDAEGRYVVYNDKLLDLYPKSAPFVAPGVKFEDALRQGAIAGEYPGLTGAAEIDAFVRAWTGRFSDPAAFQGEGALADGRWVLVSHHGTSDGGCVNVYTDITILKQREADLAGAKARLEKQAEELMAVTDDLRSARQAAEEANRSKSSFLADMSHELRTPLNAILGFSDIIRSEMFGKIEQPRYIEYAGDIHRSGAHLLALINDLLDLSKIEANKLTLKIEAISMVDLVDHAMRLVAGLAKERGVTVIARGHEICPIVHADERQARQILLNLLSNAVKFTPDGGTVTVRAVADDENGVVLSVTDTGVGMTEPELKTALERFGQLDSNNNLVKSIPGTGLGLPLVEAITKLHGGTFGITSRKGQGTTVTVRLPWHEEVHRDAGRRRNTAL